jgi:hypothetical protein
MENYNRLYNKRWATKMQMNGYTFAITKEDNKCFLKLLRIASVKDGVVSIWNSNYDWQEIPQGQYDAIYKQQGYGVVKVLEAR